MVSVPSHLQGLQHHYQFVVTLAKAGGGGGGGGGAFAEGQGGPGALGQGARGRREGSHGRPRPTLVRLTAMRLLRRDTNRIRVSE